MSDKEIKYTIKITGTEDVDRALRTAAKKQGENADHFLKQEARKTAAVEKENAKRTKEYEKMFANIEKAEQKSASEAIKAEEKLTNQINKENAKRTKEYEKAQEKRYRLMQQEMKMQEKSTAFNSRNVNTLSQFVSSAGMYRTGHLLRAVSSASQTAEGASEAGFSMTAIAGAGVALAVVAVAAAAVYTGFKVLTMEMETVGHAFANAIMEIGGARNLQELIVGAAKREQSTGLARMTVGPEERLSSSELDALVNKYSSNPAYGAPSQDELNKGVNKLGVNTGLQRSVLTNTSVMDTLLKLGHLTGTSPEDMFGSYSSTFAQNRNLTPDQVLDIMKNQFVTGRKYSASMQEFATSGQRLGSIPGTYLSGDFVENSKLINTAGAYIKAKTPGGSLEEAGTGIEAVLRTLEQHRSSAKQLGVNFDKNGKITNAAESLANIVSDPSRAQAIISELSGRETAPTIGRLSTGLPGITETSSKNDIKQAFLSMIQGGASATLPAGQLNNENAELITSTDRLKSAFNNIGAALDPSLTNILNQLTPKVQVFADTIGKSAPELTAMMTDLLNAGLALTPVLMLLAKIISVITTIVGATVQAEGFILKNTPGFDALTGGAGTALFNAGKDLLDSQINARKALNDFATDLPTIVAQIKTNLATPPTPPTPTAEPLTPLIPSPPFKEPGQATTTNHDQDAIMKSMREAAELNHQAALIQLDAANNRGNRGDSSPDSW